MVIIIFFVIPNKFCYLLADFINGKIDGNELFDNSYGKKLENLEPTVFGIRYHDDENDSGNEIKSCKIVSTENNNLEYEIRLYPTEGVPYKIQDCCSNVLFSVFADEHGVITISYRLSNFLHKIQSINIFY